MTDVWAYRSATLTQGQDLRGYDAVASDGPIGTVEQATDGASESYLVVDTGSWMPGSRRLVPAGAVEGVNHDAMTVRILLTTDQVRSAPDYDSDGWDDASRTRHSDYYQEYLQ